MTGSVGSLGSRRGWARRAGRVGGWLALGVTTAVLLLLVVLPRLAGASAYTVLTGSMEPVLPPGELVVVRPVDPAAVRVGDIVTYQVESGRPAVVTHRVVGVGVDGSGERSFRLRGDANGADDLDPVRPEQLRGVLWYHVPLLGRLNSALTGGQRSVVVPVVVGGLLLYAAIMWGGALRARRRVGRPGRHRRPRGSVGARPESSATDAGASP
ncbi:signal peptidase I [Herbiconiux sp. P18]|uniref:signal peptidase I n=1 Tax=Herbiconiux liangxiaofengii TaxID=3342795 RepID=UPI0035BA2B91